MTWYGLVQPSSGDLVSVGTEAMFPNGDLNAFVGIYDTHVFGATAPDFAVNLWNPASRTLVPRPAPVLISRLDDIEAWLLADVDWSTAWATLNATPKTQLRNGLRRVLAAFVGGQQWRQENEQVEL